MLGDKEGALLEMFKWCILLNPFAPRNFGEKCPVKLVGSFLAETN